MANTARKLGKAGLVAAGALTVALMVPRPAFASWYIPAGMGHPPIIQPVTGTDWNSPENPPANPPSNDPSPPLTIAAWDGFLAWGRFPAELRLPFWYHGIEVGIGTPANSPSQGGAESGQGSSTGDGGAATGSGGGSATGGSGGGSANLPSGGYSWGSNAEVQSVLSSLNALRAGQGLGPLAIDPELTRLAKLRLADLANHHVVEHDTPSYGMPIEMERAAGDHWRVMGAENLAANRTAGIAERALEGDPAHRSNILLPGHNLVGIAIVHNPYGVTLDELFAGN